MCRTTGSGASASELGELVAWRHDPYPARTEIDDQAGVSFDAGDQAEAVLIVGHLVVHGELLGRENGGRGEGARGQNGPDSDAGGSHDHQHALLLARRAAGLPEARIAGRTAARLGHNAVTARLAARARPVPARRASTSPTVRSWLEGSGSGRCTWM